jgi:hypothetical protein
MNSTTIENLAKGQVNYDAGLLTNWRQVFGANKWLWMLPVERRSGRPVGDGIHWTSDSDLIDSDSKSDSEYAQTPRVMSNSAINPALMTSSNPIAVLLCPSNLD